MPSDMRSSQLRLVTCVLDVLRASRSFVRSVAKINLFRIPQVLPSNSREREYSHYQTSYLTCPDPGRRVGPVFPFPFSANLFSCFLSTYFRHPGPSLAGRHILIVCAAD